MLPEQCLKEQKTKDIEVAIINEWKKLTDVSQTDVQFRYVTTVHKLSTYGFTWYTAKEYSAKKKTENKFSSVFQKKV